jgi:hypothetical protein
LAGLGAIVTGMTAPGYDLQLTTGVALDRLERQVSRLAETTEVGFTRMQLALQDNNQLIADNNAVIRRLLDILARGRGNGEGPPA